MQRTNKINHTPRLLFYRRLIAENGTGWVSKLYTIPGAVPLTMLLLILMENFKGTRPLASLMPYTGEEKKEERLEAAKNVKGLWGKVKVPFTSDHTTEDSVS